MSEPDPNHQPLRIGLTGGIASGKSAAADHFAQLGARVIDTDVIAREVVEPGQPGLKALTDEFGQDILTSEGTLDRRKLRQLVFSDPARRQQLDALLHPLIRAATLATGAATAAQDPYQIFVVPLLIEAGFIKLVDRVALVDCPVETQLARLMARDGMDETQARAMIDAQLDREERISAADDIISNTGALTDLHQAVEALHSKYLELAAN